MGGADVSVSVMGRRQKFVFLLLMLVPLRLTVAEAGLTTQTINIFTRMNSILLQSCRKKKTLFNASSLIFCLLSALCCCYINGVKLCDQRRFDLFVSQFSYKCFCILYFASLFCHQSAKLRLPAV